MVEVLLMLVYMTLMVLLLCSVAHLIGVPPMALGGEVVRLRQRLQGLRQLDRLPIWVGDSLKLSSFFLSFVLLVGRCCVWNVRRNDYQQQMCVNSEEIWGTQGRCDHEGRPGSAIACMIALDASSGKLEDLS